ALPRSLCFAHKLLETRPLGRDCIRARDQTPDAVMPPYRLPGRCDPLIYLVVGRDGVIRNCRARWVTVPAEHMQRWPELLVCDPAMSDILIDGDRNWTRVRLASSA